MATVYTTRGITRGSCGHRHKTIKLALSCVERDRDECGGITDRQVIGVGRALTEHELRYLSSHR